MKKLISTLSTLSLLLSFNVSANQQVGVGNRAIASKAVSHVQETIDSFNSDFDQMSLHQKRGELNKLISIIDGLRLDISESKATIRNGESLFTAFLGTMVIAGGITTIISSSAEAYNKKPTLVLRYERASLRGEMNALNKNPHSPYIQKSVQKRQAKINNIISEYNKTARMYATRSKFGAVAMGLGLVTTIYGLINLEETVDITAEEKEMLSEQLDIIVNYYNDLKDSLDDEYELENF